MSVVTVTNMNSVTLNTQNISMHIHDAFGNNKVGQIFNDAPDGENLYYLTPGGTLKLLSGGTVNVTGEMTQLVFRPGSINPELPVYNDLDTLMGKVAENQVANLTTTVIMDDSLAACNVTNSYDATNVIFEGRSKSALSRTAVNFTGNGQLLNPLGFSSVNIVVNGDFSVPRILLQHEGSTTTFESSDIVVSGMVANEPVVRVEANNVYILMKTSSAFVDATAAHGYITFSDNNLDFRIILTSDSRVDGSIFYADGHTGIVVGLLIDSDVVPPPIALTDGTINYAVVLTSQSEFVRYNDGSGGYSLVKQPSVYQNVTSVQEALDGCKRGFQQIYYRPNAPANANNFPFFSTMGEILTVIGNPENAENAYELILDDTYQNPITLTDFSLDCDGRVIVSGKHQNTEPASRVNLNISNPVTGLTGFINCPKFSFINFNFNQDLTGLPMTWSTNNTCVFNYCSFEIDPASTGVPLLARDNDVVLTFNDCRFNDYTGKPSLLGQTVLHVMVAYINNSIVDKNLAPNGNIRVFLLFNAGCDLTNATFPTVAGHVYFLSDNSANVLYANSSPLVPAPTIPQAVSVKEVIDALVANASNNVTVPFDTLRTSLGSSIGLYGVSPVTQQGPGVEPAGFTANASANAAYKESTFTGGIGASAYSIGQIVRALKNMGVLAM